MKCYKKVVWFAKPTQRLEEPDTIYEFDDNDAKTLGMIRFMGTWQKFLKPYTVVFEEIKNEIR